MKNWLRKLLEVTIWLVMLFILAGVLVFGVYAMGNTIAEVLCWLSSK
jgi:hypothetical protein